MNRRGVVRRLLSASLIASVAPAAFAQSAASDKPVRLVVPFPPGGAADLVGRALAQKLTLSLEQPVIVENKGGAAGAIGSEFVSKAAPDGQTLLLGTISTHGTNPALNPKNYDPMRDFSHLSLVASNALVFIVHPSVQANTVQEFVRLAKGKPGMPFGSNGNGSYNHLSVELFKEMAQIDLLHVPYKGAGPVMTDLVGGQILFAAADLAGAAPFIRSGKVRALAVASPQRVPGFDLPTVMESGYPNFEVTAWYAMFGPPNMSPALVAKLHDAIAQAVESPDIQERLQAIGAIGSSETPAQLRARVQREVSRWTAVIKTANIKRE